MQKTIKSEGLWWSGFLIGLELPLQAAVGQCVNKLSVIPAKRWHCDEHIECRMGRYGLWALKVH